MPFVKEEEEEVGQIVSLGDSRIKRVRDRIALKHANSLSSGPGV